MLTHLCRITCRRRSAVADAGMFLVRISRLDFRRTPPLSHRRSSTSSWQRCARKLKGRGNKVKCKSDFPTASTDADRGGHAKSAFFSVPANGHTTGLARGGEAAHYIHAGRPFSTATKQTIQSDRMQHTGLSTGRVVSSYQHSHRTASTTPSPRHKAARSCHCMGAGFYLHRGGPIRYSWGAHTSPSFEPSLHRVKRGEEGNQHVAPACPPLTHPPAFPLAEPVMEAGRIAPLPPRAEPLPPACARVSFG